MRQKHPRRDGEEALAAIEALGWEATRKKRYYQLRCSCGKGHLTHLHLSPSNPNHFKEKVRSCRRVCNQMIVRVGVAFDVRESGAVPDQDELAAHLGDVMDELMSIESVIDPDVSATLSEGHVEIWVSLDAEDELKAHEEAIVTVRSAIHAAGRGSSWSRGRTSTRSSLSDEEGLDLAYRELHRSRLK